VRKCLTYHDVEIMTPVDGVVTRLTDGIKAVIDAHYLEDLKVMIRRGMSGVVRSGRHAGGRAYGYRSIPGRPGELEIDADQAAIVQHIFSEYAAGKTPRAIARELNRRGIAAPRGRAWNASTINGWGTRGAGILNNPIYIGRIVWNKNRMVKNPDTRRRVSRANPESAWQTTDAPTLAIVPVETFELARKRRAAAADTLPVYQRAPRHLFSGLLRCGACGSGMSAFGADRSGRRRIRCTGAAERGDCPAPRTFHLDSVESLVLDALKAELRKPDTIAAFVREYHAERQRLARNAAKSSATLERRLEAIAREVKRAVDGICQGIGDPVALGARTKELALERSEVERALEAMPKTTEAIVLHPTVLSRYEDQVAALQTAMTHELRKGDSEPARVLRELIETVTVNAEPSAPSGLRIEIAGRLRALLGNRAFPSGSAVCGKLVAEDGFEPPTHGL
jgi:DNA invertase Pin-like site-specific DNA recombinase